MGSDLRVEVSRGDRRYLRRRSRGVGAFPSRARRLICGESRTERCKHINKMLPSESSCGQPRGRPSRGLTELTQAVRAPAPDQSEPGPQPTPDQAGTRSDVASFLVNPP